MRAIIIRGGRPLSGSLTVQGAKNSVLPILAATLFSGECAASGTVPVCGTWRRRQISCGIWAAVRTGRAETCWWTPQT